MMQLDGLWIDDISLPIPSIAPSPRVTWLVFKL
jgi:hypothetical protein